MTACCLRLLCVRGLVTYRETLLLYQPALNSASEFQGMVRVIAHELAHQWFGDIVTMQWWSDVCRALTAMPPMTAHALPEHVLRLTCVCLPVVWWLLLSSG